MKSTCHVCKSKKLADSLDSLYIYVERGTPDGHEYTFSDAADEYINVRSGDIKVKVQIMPHPVFERVNEDDLKMYMNITLKEALLGFEKTVTHLDGHFVDVYRRN